MWHFGVLGKPTNVDTAEDHHEIDTAQGMASKLLFVSDAILRPGAPKARNFKP